MKDNYHYTWFTWNWNVGNLVKKEKAEKTIHTIISPKNPTKDLYLIRNKSNYLKKIKPEVIGGKRIKIDFYNTGEKYLTEGDYILFRHKSDPEDIIRFGFIRYSINLKNYSEEETIRLFPLEKQNESNYLSLETYYSFMVCVKDIITWAEKATVLKKINKGMDIDIDLFY